MFSKRNMARRRDEGWFSRWGWAAALSSALILGSTCNLPAPVASSRSNDVLPPAAAGKIVKDYWAANERAAATHDLEQFAQIETGPLLDVDRGSTQANKALALPGPVSPRPLHKVTTLVPHQRGYPAQFLALIETVTTDRAGRLTTQPLTFLEHFTRQSPADSWKADFYVPVDPSRGLKFAIDRDGFITALPTTSRKYVLEPDQLAAALIDYWQGGLSTGTPVGPFAPGSWTSDSVRAQRDHAAGMSRLGYQTDSRFIARPFVQAYATDTGDAIVLFAFDATELISVPDPNGCIVQPADRLQRWGGLVLAGAYSSVSTDYLLELVASDPLAGPAAKVDVLAGTQDATAARTGRTVPGCHD